MLHAPRGVGSPLGGMELPGYDKDPASADNAEVQTRLGSSRHCFVPWVSLFLGAKLASVVRFLAVVFPYCFAIRSNLHHLWRKNNFLRVKPSLQLEGIRFTKKKGFPQTAPMLMAKFRRNGCNYQKWSLDQRITVILPSSCEKMSERVVRAHPSMLKLVFRKLFESNFLLECSSMIFLKIAYPPHKSFLRVYIWDREYGLAVLAGPIVMIAAHRVAKQSWPFWCEVMAVRRVFKWQLSPQFMIFGTRDAPGNLKRFGSVLSSIYCIEDEW